MKEGWKLAFAVLCGVVFGLLASGLIVLIARQPTGQPVTLLPPPAPAPLTVHVTGAVQRPGVYSLPAGSRVQDAIQAAGGLTEHANADALNLAALLQDGERIHVPDPAAQQPATPARGSSGKATPASPRQEKTATPFATQSPTLDPAHPININTASLQELERLPRIGPATAQYIITYREANGPFKTIEEIMNVPNIGPKTFAIIRPYITVNDSP